MGRPVKGDVVIVPFPFSDLSASKKRPALVINAQASEDIILFQITSQPYGDPFSVILQPFDFVKEPLSRTSFIRPNKIFTADLSIIISHVGHVKREKLDEVISKAHEILNNP